MIGVKNAKQPIARQEVEDAFLAEREPGTSHRPCCHSLCVIMSWLVGQRNTHQCCVPVILALILGLEVEEHLALQG